MNKEKGPDGNSAKLVKTLSDIINCHIANVINKYISENKCSEEGKTANATSIFLKKDKAEIKITVLSIY